MSLILVVSIAIRFVALVWSVVLVRRLRDWRMGLMTAMLALMALRQTLTLVSTMESWTITVPQATTEIPGLVVSVLAFLAVFFLGRMIGDERRAVEALQASQEQLQQKKKVEAIGRMAAGVSHDFNNLLTVIMSHAENVLARSEEAGREDRDAAAIIDASERAAALTRKMLALGKGEVLRPERFDLNEKIAGMSETLEKLAGERVQVETSFSPGMVRVEFDPGQLERIVLNLVANARDALPEGGRVEISTARAELDESDAEAIPGVTPGSFVKLSVADDGTGMDARTRERVFDPFFTTKGPEQGSGLGLSTAIGVVSQSGGGITVDSALGEGTRFDVFLPPG